MANSEGGGKVLPFQRWEHGGSESGRTLRYRRVSEQWGEDSHLVLPLYSAPVLTPGVPAGLPRPRAWAARWAQGGGGTGSGVRRDCISLGHSCPFLFLPSFPFPLPPLHVSAASRWKRARRAWLQPWSRSRIQKLWREMPGVLRLVLGEAARYNWASESTF